MRFFFNVAGRATRPNAMMVPGDATDPPLAFTSPQGTLVPSSRPARQKRGIVSRFVGRRASLAALILASLALVLSGWGYWAMRRRSQTPEAIWDQAETDFLAGRYALVEQALNRLGGLRSPTPFDRMLRAQLALVRKQPDRAIAELSRVPDDHHLAPQARLLTGQVELRRNRVRFAEEALLAGLRIDPGLVQAHRELIYIYGMQLRREAIGREFLALSKLVDLTFDNVFHWCMLRNNSWEPREVVEALTGYLAADPFDRWSRLALAENLRRMGLASEAEAALAVLPRGDSEANLTRIQIALDRQELERADELLALGPSDDPALARLRGRQALAKRDAKSAVRYLRIAYDADPDNLEVVRGLLSALMSAGDEKEARQVRERAALLDELSKLILRAVPKEAHGDSALIRALGTTCAALSRYDEARAWFKVAIAREPLDSQAQQALFRLKSASRAETGPARPSH
jgi:tetratricopeptide (TPR) repeat protein